MVYSSFEFAVLLLKLNAVIKNLMCVCVFFYVYKIHFWCFIIVEYYFYIRYLT